MYSSPPTPLGRGCRPCTSSTWNHPVELATCAEEDLLSELWVKTLLALEKQQFENCSPWNSCFKHTHLIQLAEICRCSSQIWDEIKLQLAKLDDLICKIIAPRRCWSLIAGVHCSIVSTLWLQTLLRRSQSYVNPEDEWTWILNNPRWILTPWVTVATAASCPARCLKLPNALDLGEGVWVVPGGDWLLVNFATKIGAATNFGPSHLKPISGSFSDFNPWKKCWVRVWTKQISPKNHHPKSSKIIAITSLANLRGSLLSLQAKGSGVLHIKLVQGLKKQAPASSWSNKSGLPSGGWGAKG